MAKMGLLGATSRVTGAQAQRRMYRPGCQELERGDGALRSFMSVRAPGDVPDLKVRKRGRSRWLPRMAKGESSAASGLPKPTAARSGGDEDVRQARRRRLGDHGASCGSPARHRKPGGHWAMTDEESAGSWSNQNSGLQGAGTAAQFSLRASVSAGADWTTCGSRRGTCCRRQRVSGPLGCLTQARYGIAGARSAVRWRASQRCWTTPSPAFSSAAPCRIHRPSSAPGGHVPPHLDARLWPCTWEAQGQEDALRAGVDGQVEQHRMALDIARDARDCWGRGDHRRTRLDSAHADMECDHL